MSEYIGLAFLLSISVAALMLLFIPLRKLLRSLLWKHASATVLGTQVVYEIVGRYPMGGRMVATYGYAPKISYRYQVGNEHYESNSIVDALEEPVWFRTEAKADRFVDSITAGGKVKVFYDPRNPRNSVVLNRVRVADVLGLIIGCSVSTLFFHLAISLWPTAVPELDFPLYDNAEIYSYPDKDDQRKFWILTSGDSLDDVTAFYDADAGNGWQSSGGWQPGLGESVYKVWVRESSESGHQEKVTVRIQKEKQHVRKGLELSIGYRRLQREDVLRSR